MAAPEKPLANEYGLGAFIRKHRKVAELTVSDLAQRVGKTGSWLSRVEHDLETPALLTLHAIARELGVEPADMLKAAGLVDLNVQRRLTAKERVVGRMYEIISLLSGASLLQARELLEQLLAEQEGTSDTLG